MVPSTFISPTTTFLLVWGPAEHVSSFVLQTLIEDFVLYCPEIFLYKRLLKSFTFEKTDYLFLPHCHMHQHVREKCNPCQVIITPGQKLTNIMFKNASNISVVSFCFLPFLLKKKENVFIYSCICLYTPLPLWILPNALCLGFERPQHLIPSQSSRTQKKPKTFFCFWLDKTSWNQ